MVNFLFVFSFLVFMKVDDGNIDEFMAEAVLARDESRMRELILKAMNFYLKDDVSPVTHLKPSFLLFPFC